MRALVHALHTDPVARVRAAFFSVTRVRAILFREIARPRSYAWLNNGRDVKSVWSVHQRKILFSEL